MRRLHAQLGYAPHSGRISPRVGTFLKSDMHSPEQILKKIGMVWREWRSPTASPAAVGVEPLKDGALVDIEADILMLSIGCCFSRGLVYCFAQQPGSDLKGASFYGLRCPTHSRVAQARTLSKQMNIGCPVQPSLAS